MGKRIVYLVQGLETGGLERMVFLLAREMVLKGHEVTICCYDKLGQLSGAATSAGIGVKLIKRRPGVDWRYILALKRWLRRKRPDVLHMHNDTAFFYGTLAGCLARVRTLIYTEHDSVFPRSLFCRLVNRWLVKRLTRATAVSEAIKQLWCHGDGIDPVLVSVVPNGIPGEAFICHKERKKTWGLRIGTVGRLSPEKGVDILIEAFRQVRERISRVELLVVGDGSAREHLEELVVGHGLTDAVRFLGWRGDVPRLLASFDMYVLPSRREGLPLVILEAMASSLPIVSTNVGGVPEAIRNGETGILVPPEDPGALADAIVNLAGDPERMVSLGRNARIAFEQRYELSRMVAAYEKLMEV